MPSPQTQLALVRCASPTRIELLIVHDEDNDLAVQGGEERAMTMWWEAAGFAIAPWLRETIAETRPLD